MKKLLLPAVVVILAIAGTIGVISCGSGNTSNTQPDIGTSPPGQTTTASSTIPVVTQVTMQGLAFNPDSITVPAGTEVTWVNDDSVTHTVTSNTGLFESSNIVPGGTFSFTFTNPGTYDYHCSLHPTMRGTVVVQ